MENTLERIHKAGLRFLVPLTSDETYKTIAEEAMKLVKADYATIYLERDGVLERVYASSPKVKHINIRQNGFTYQAFSSHNPYVVSEKKLQKIHPEVTKLGVKSTILIPLTYKNKSIGVLSVDSRKSEFFTKKELLILKLFGSTVSLALRKTQLYDETKKALELRDLFISIASHELRTPLTSLNGYIQLLYSRFQKKDTPEANWVRELYEESKRLTNLVSELLEINRIKRGELQFVFQEASLKEIIEKAVERYKFVNNNHTIIVEDTVGNLEDIVIGDFNKLLQVVSNLINNAIKFSPSKASIVISLAKNKKMLVLRVIDKGEGIEAADLPKLFQEFYKGANSLRDQKEGLGMGLMLSKHIVAAHKGTIEILSERDKGTVVEVRMPQAKIHE
jgi:K+-sensing histidine kinase KdpD